MAAKLAFNESSIIDMVNAGVVNSSTDLTGALQASPALLQTQLDPDTMRRTQLHAKARISRANDKLGVSEPTSMCLLSVASLDRVYRVY